MALQRRFHVSGKELLSASFVAGTGIFEQEAEDHLLQVGAGATDLRDEAFDPQG